MSRTQRSRVEGPAPQRCGGGALDRCVGDPTIFADQVWGQVPIHHRSVDDFSDLLTLEDVDVMVASAVRRPAIRLVRDGAAIPASSYCTPLRIGGQRVDEVVDAAKVRDQLDAGATIVLQSLHRTWPPIARFTEALEREISHTVQANAYLTPAGSAGLRSHRDGHDVIVVQLLGSKRWSVAGLGDLTLQPGDTLYLPSGTEHGAETRDEFSLHLTIGILCRTYRHVIDRLLMKCETLDEALPIGFAHDPHGLASALHDELNATTDFLREADPAIAANDIVDRHRPRSYQQGSISSLLGADEVSDETEIVLADAHTKMSTEPCGRICLELRDRTLTLPAYTRAPLDQIREGSPLPVATLRDLSADSRLVLVRRLIREGMLRLSDSTSGPGPARLEVLPESDIEPGAVADRRIE